MLKPNTPNGRTSQRFQDWRLSHTLAPNGDVIPLSDSKRQRPLTPAEYRRFLEERGVRGVSNIKVLEGGSYAWDANPEKRKAIEHVIGISLTDPEPTASRGDTEIAAILRESVEANRLQAESNRAVADALTLVAREVHALREDMRTGRGQQIESLATLAGLLERLAPAGIQAASAS